VKKDDMHDTDDPSSATNRCIPFANPHDPLSSVSASVKENSERNQQLLPLILHAEIAIRESFVMSGHIITDNDVRAALESLASLHQNDENTRAFQEPVNARQEKNTENLAENNTTENFIVWNIRQHWKEYWKDRPSTNYNDIVIAVRSLLSSLECYENTDSASQGYLQHLEGFLTKTERHHGPNGPTTPSILDRPPNMECSDSVPSEADDELLITGLAWIEEGDTNAKIVFRTLADEMISTGEIEDVCKTCTQLLYATEDPQVNEVLQTILTHAKQRQKPRPSGWQHLLSRFLGG
jgi:hypothetical protein